jgi:hypothetical protein
MLTRSAIDVGEVEAARKVYSVIRHINLAGGGGLEAHERVSLLTVAAGLRSFCLLTHIREEEFPLVTAALPVVGLTCRVCKASFNYDLDVDAPPEVLEAFRAYEARHPLYGLGVANSRVDFGETPLGTVLGYPKCCSEMDDKTKAFDRSATLRLLIDSKDGDYAALVAELVREHTTIPTPPTDRREAWDRRFDRTHDVFPFAVHTACDQCLEAGSKSPSDLLSRRYEAMVRVAAPDLYDFVLRQNDIFRQTSKFPV